MLTPRDRFRIPLILVGVSFTLTGIAAAVSDRDVTAADYVYRIGAWKDLHLVSTVPKEAAPWMLGFGVAALVISYVTRDK